MYVINDSNSAVTLFLDHYHCFNGTIPDPVNIKPHHKQTIIIKVAEDIACVFESTRSREYQTASQTNNYYQSR